MGEPLYEQVVGKVADGKLNRPCRIYAPVGTHETLLAYLVRRLLENGANTSFVNRIADTTCRWTSWWPTRSGGEKLAQQEGQVGLPHPKIPLPRDLYGSGRATPRVWIWPTNTVWPPSPLPCSTARCRNGRQTDAGAAGGRRRNAAGD
jgi:RHH-type proline utilization regulon transcriptional repressor/proline dehydrogenase/delta 1-pyrroline-5-carboxylate dehydrogenase